MIPSNWFTLNIENTLNKWNGMKRFQIANWWMIILCFQNKSFKCEENNKKIWRKMFYWIILSLKVYSSSVFEYVVITKINSKYHHTTTVICSCGIYGFLLYLYFTSTRFMVYLMKTQGCAILFSDKKVEFKRYWKIRYILNLLLN